MHEKAIRGRFLVKMLFVEDAAANWKSGPVPIQKYHTGPQFQLTFRTIKYFTGDKHESPEEKDDLALGIEWAFG